MADVARAAGVNKSTVSHVLNGTRIVSEPTRELVLQAISTTGYRHNAVARSLATSKTMSLGLAISSAANPYFGGLIRAVEASASASGYMLMLADTHDDAEVERRVVEELLGRRIDGILLAPSAHAIDRALPYLESIGAPTVLIDRFVEAEVDQVGSENAAATSHLVAHLAEIGHRRIAMVCGLRGLPSTSERLRGFRQAVADFDLDDDTSLELDGGSEASRAEHAVLELFSKPERPSAIVVGNNAMTIGTMRALNHLGLRVPDNIALVCYDDFEWADLFHPRLTAMEQNVARIGSIAVDLVVNRIQDASRPVQRKVLRPVYHHRDSCGCATNQTAVRQPLRSSIRR